jgi:hypothetical protein
MAFTLDALVPRHDPQCAFVTSDPDGVILLESDGHQQGGLTMVDWNDERNLQDVHEDVRSTGPSVVVTQSGDELATALIYLPIDTFSWAVEEGARRGLRWSALVRDLIEQERRRTST